MADPNYALYKEPINDKVTPKEMTQNLDNSSTSAAPINTLTPVSNYTPNQIESNKIVYEKNPYEICSKKQLYVYDFILIGFCLADFIFYCFGAYNFFVIFDNIISLISSIALLICLITRFRACLLLLLFFIATLSLASRIYGWISFNNQKSGIYGWFMFIGFFNFAFRSFFNLTFLFITCCSS